MKRTDSESASKLLHGRVAKEANMLLDKLHAYFRGRHLHGTTLSLPSHYTGTVLHITEKDVPSSTDTTTGNNSIEEEDEENENIETKVADKAAEFDEVVIWGHGGPVDESEDVYVRGMREWIGFAEAMHGGGDDDEEMAEGQSKKRS